MADIKALSDYFEHGGKWGDGEQAVTLSAPKLIRAITDAVLVRKPLYKKVFKVADHFYVDKDGAVKRYGTVGQFRQEAIKEGYTKQTRPRGGKEGKTVYDDSYRDFAIVDVPEFEAWLSKTVADSKTDVVVKRAGKGEGKPATASGIYSLAAFRRGHVDDMDSIAKSQAEVIQKRKDRGEELGNSRKDDSKASTGRARK